MRGYGGRDLANLQPGGEGIGERDGNMGHVVRVAGRTEYCIYYNGMVAGGRQRGRQGGKQGGVHKKTCQPQSNPKL